LATSGTQDTQSSHRKIITPLPRCLTAEDTAVGIAAEVVEATAAVIAAATEATEATEMDIRMDIPMGKFVLVMSSSLLAEARVLSDGSFHSSTEWPVTNLKQANAPSPPKTTHIYVS
jgi:hypothetical protein